MRSNQIGSVKAVTAVATVAGITIVAAMFCFGCSLSNGYLVRSRFVRGASPIASGIPTSLMLVSTAQGGPRFAQDNDQSSANDSFSLMGDNAPGATFERVYLLLKRNFVDAITDDSKLSHGAAAAMIASLNDPDSRFVDEPELLELRDQAHGIYTGAGIVWSVKKITHAKTSDGIIPEYTELRLSIKDVVPGSAADAAGLKTGDVVTHVDGHFLASYNPVVSFAKDLKAAQQDPVAFNKLAAKLQKIIDTALSVTQTETMLDAPIKKPIVLIVTRSGAPPSGITKTIGISSVANPSSVSATMSDKTLALKVSQITGQTGTSVAQAIAAHGTATAVTLDLSDDPGGSVEDTADLAANFMDGGSLGTLETSGNKKHDILVLGGKATKLPLTIIVNHGTAGTAEILAETLQEHGDKIIGQPTFGDTNVVQLFQLKDGSGFTLLTGHLLSGNGTDLQNKGVKPNITENIATTKQTAA